MTTGTSGTTGTAGKKALIGFVSSLAWVFLVLSLLATTANFVMNGLSKVGGSAASLVETISSNPSALNSLIDEFEKGADSKAVREIEKNRAAIEETLASLGKSEEFRNSLEKTLNDISDAVLNGSSSVTVDFSDLANQVAAKINAAAKSTVITKANLEEVVPATLDLSEQSETIANVKKVIHLSLFLWVIWFALMGVLVLLKGRRVLQTSGIQLVSVGILAIGVHFLAPWGLNRANTSADLAEFQRDAISEAFKIVSSPSLLIGVVATVVGLILVFVSRINAKKTRSDKEPAAI
jgi:hypothetical protein